MKKKNKSKNASAAAAATSAAEAAATTPEAPKTTPVRNAEMIPAIIISTCSQNTIFNVYERHDPHDRRIPRTLRKITLVGGANVTNATNPVMLPKQGLTFIVPNGTPLKAGQISVDDYKALRENSAYERMKSRGFFREVGSEEDTRLDAKGNAADMNPRDKSSQIFDSEHAHGTDTVHFNEMAQENHASTTAFAGPRDRYIGEQAVVASNYGVVPPPGQAV